jgi:hypothetical protein
MRPDSRGPVEPGTASPRPDGRGRLAAPPSTRPLALLGGLQVAVVALSAGLAILFVARVWKLPAADRAIMAPAVWFCLQLPLAYLPGYLVGRLRSRRSAPLSPEDQRWLTWRAAAIHMLAVVPLLVAGILAGTAPPIAILVLAVICALAVFRAISGGLGIGSRA